YFREQSRHEPSADADLAAEGQEPGRQDYRGQPSAGSEPDEGKESEPAGLLESSGAAVCSAGQGPGACGSVSASARQWGCGGDQGNSEGAFRAAEGGTPLGDGPGVYSIVHRGL